MKKILIADDRYEVVELVKATLEGGVKVPTIEFKTVGATLLVTPYIKGEFVCT